MTHLSTIELTIALYGALGGWFGIAVAYYTARIRQPPTNWKVTLSFFAVGFAMLVLAVNILAFHQATPAWLAMFALAFTALSLAEVVAFTRLAFDLNDHTLDSHAVLTEVYADIRRFIMYRPRFDRHVANPPSEDDDPLVANATRDPNAGNRNRH